MLLALRRHFSLRQLFHDATLHPVRFDCDRKILLLPQNLRIETRGEVQLWSEDDQRLLRLVADGYLNKRQIYLVIFTLAVDDRRWNTYLL